MRISFLLLSQQVHLSLRVQFVAVILVWLIAGKCLQGAVGSGSEFQIVGAANENDLQPHVFNFADGTVRSLLDDDLKLIDVVEEKSSLEDCRVIQFKPATHNHSLMGHVMKSVWVTSEAGCEANCFAEDDCMSINFGPKSQEKHLCELSSSDHNLHSEDLKERSSFIYKSMWNHCPRSPCNPGYRCQVGFTSKGYRCIDINECTEGGHDCHVNANCTNIVGSYNCSCEEGYFKNGRLCAENWKKINKIPVCFQGLDDNYGTFRINASGLIYTFKLVYKSGSMKCRPDQQMPSNWGCTHRGFGENQLLTVVTHRNRSVLFPVDYLGDNNECYKYYAYHLEGIDVNSPELVFNRLIPPMSVTEGQEFQIWHGEDLANCGEKDNTGQTCVDVHAWYT